MPFVPTFSVVPRDGGFVVTTTNERGIEFTCTVVTREKSRAERWAFELRRAAQVETDRRNAVLKGTRRLEDD